MYLTADNTKRHRASFHTRPLRILPLLALMSFAASSASAVGLASGRHPFLSFDVMIEIPSPPQRYFMGELRDFLRALKKAGYACKGEAHISTVSIACGEGNAQTLIELAVKPTSISPNNLRIVSIRIKGRSGMEIPVDEFATFLSTFLNP